MTNEKVRMLFDNIAEIIEFRDERALNWMGKEVRMSKEKIPRKIIAAWVNNPRKIG